MDQTTIIDRPKEVKCPMCDGGYLSELDEEDFKKLEIKEGTKLNSQSIWGCDECQHFTDEDYLFENND